MKITVKTLKGDENFTLDNVTEEQTVLELKQNVSSVKSWEVDTLKLIHAGKIMQNDKLVKDYKVKDGGFIVCMVTKKKKPAPKPPAQESTPPPATTSTPAQNASQEAPATPAAQQSAPATQAPAPTPNASPAFEAAVTQLRDMGFPEDQCRQALQAAFGNADRAVEYLMNGIPEGAGLAQQAQGDAATQGQQQDIQSGGGDLQALRNHPQFNMLRRIVQTNPQALGTVLQELGRSEPGLIQAINANREQFVAMMNEPIEENDQANAGGAGASDMSDLGNLLQGGNGMPNPQQLAQVVQAMQNLPPERRSQLATAMGIPLEQLQAITQMMQSLPPEALAQMLASGGAGGPGGMGGRNVVTLTQDEMAAIDRLVELGFPKQACVEAYLACDKNEELAANYLFTNPPEEDTPMEE